MPTEKPMTEQTQTMRGVVICPKFAVTGPNFELNCDVEATALRRYLLYWDKIAYAYPNGLGKPNFNALLDLGFLSEIGVLSLHDVPVSTSKIGRNEVPNPVHLSEAPTLISGGPRTPENPSGIQFLGCPADVWPELSTFAQLHVATNVAPLEGGIWTVGEFNAELSTVIFPNALEELLEATLYASLPVPTDETPLVEIAEFRDRRRGELIQLRHAIDRLRSEAMLCSDSARGVQKAKEEIELALLQIHQTLHEAGIRTFFSTLKLYLGVKDSPAITALLGALGATGVGLGATGIGLPLAVGSAVGLTVNTILTFVDRQLDKSRGLPTELSDFAYLYDIEKYWPSSGAS